MSDSTTIVRYLCPNLYRASRVFPELDNREVILDLKPGINTIPTPTFKAFYNPEPAEGEDEYVHPGVGHLIANDQLEIVQVVKGSPKQEGVNYKEIGEKQAIKMAKDSFDREALRTWLKKESRKKVRTAIENQIELITAKANVKNTEPEEFSSDEPSAYDLG